MHTKPLLANLVTYIRIHICFKETEDTTNQQKLPYAQVDMSKKKKKKDDKQLKVHVIVKSHYKEVIVVITRVRGGAEDECNNNDNL